MGEGRAYELIITPRAREVMAGWPKEIQAALQAQLEQLASLPLASEARHVESTITAGKRGEFTLSIELRVEAKMLIVHPSPGS